MKKFFLLFVLTFSLFLSHDSKAQGGPGGVGSTENVFWFSSDKFVEYDGSNNVTTWRDQANSNDANNNNSSTNPAFDAVANVGGNLQPAILFSSASTEFLDMTDDASINLTSITARTIFFVFRTGSDVATQQYLYQQGASVDGVFAYISGSNLTFGINSASSNYTISSGVSADTDYIVGFTYDGTAQTLDLLLNGTAATQTTSVATSIASHTNITIGSSTAGTDFLDGHLAEIIYYDVAFNDAELRVVDNYLSEKYDIAILNDHYTTADATYGNNLVGISRLSGAEHNASTGYGGSLYISENTTDGNTELIDDEHIYIGHNNNNQSTTSLDMGAIANTERYNRVWYLLETGDAGAVVEFDLIESGLYAAMPGDPSVFSLLFRAGVSGDFTDTDYTSAVKALNGDRIQFTISNTDLKSGYITIGVPATSKKWYVINDGNYNDPNTWTLDPAGSIYNNPDGLTPDSSPTTASDEVTILSGKTVTVQDNDMSGTLAKLTVDGTLDFVSSTGHGAVSLLEGSGVIKLSNDILPTFTDASNFTSTGSGAGTVEYYGSSDINLTASSGLTSFYNLSLNFDANSDHLIVTTDITVNGDLTITTGDFQINDLSTTRLIIDVQGDLTVSANGEISVGTGAISAGQPVGPSDFHDTFHRLNLSGDFTNNGTVNFSNLTAYDFRNIPTNNDCVTVSFIGQSDNTLTCNATTNFYDFVINKGNDKTYSLTVNPSAYGNFRVFGRNDVGNDINFDDPTIGKPIAIISGTLIVTGYTFIPSLSEGRTDIINDEGNRGDWIIPASSAFWINGPNVIVHGTSNSAADIVFIDTDLAPEVLNIVGVRTTRASQQSFIIMGEFKISDGIYDCRWAPGIFFSQYGSARFIIEGGDMKVSQLRNTNANASVAYNQSGGTITVIGETEGGNTSVPTIGVFDFNSTNGVFIMSGGNIVIKDYNDTAEGDPGTVNGLNINVPEGNYNVTGGTIEIDVETGDLPSEGFEISFTPNFYNLTISQDDNDSISFESNVVVTNDLILKAGTVIGMNGNDLTVGRNFNVEATAIYNRNTTSGSNTTTFNGDAGQTITLAGTVTDNFYDIVFSGTGVKTISSADLTVVNSLTIASGATLDDGGQNIIVQGSMSNSGTHQSTGSGALEFSGGTSYTVSGDDNGVFGDVNLNDGTNDVIFTADQAIVGTLTFVADDQVLHIGTHSLVMQGAGALISGYDSNNFIQTDGNASDGGLSIYIDGTGTFTFPIGTNVNNQGHTISLPPGTDPTRYTPADITISTFTDDGYITITVADDDIPSADPPGGGLLSYFWKVAHSDFTTVPQVSSYVFTHHEDDLDGSGTGSWRCGKGLSDTPYTRTTQSDYTASTNVIKFDDATLALEGAYYSAGANNRFNNTPSIYYSRQDGNWNTAATWSKNVQDGTGTQEVPAAGSVVIIQSDGAGDLHRVNVIAGINDVGTVKFDHDYITYPTPDAETVSRLQFHIAGTFELGVVSGTGMISFDAPDAPVVNGDFGEFGTNQESYYLFFGGDATLNNIPEPIPTLMMESYTYNIDQAITTNGDIIIQGNGTVIPLQNITIKRDLLIGTWIGGTFQFPDAATPITVTVEGNIDFTVDPYTNPQDRDMVVQDLGVNDVEHTIILKGDIIHGAGNGYSLDLYNGDDVSPRAILELQGESDNNYARTSTAIPELYRVILNKGTDQTNSFTFNDSFTLNGATTGSTKALELQNGTFILNDTNGATDGAINIDLSTGGNDFNISSSTALHVSFGQVNVTGTDVGITLDGAIILDNDGILDMDGGSNNFIEYSSSGSASIDVSGTSQLLVGSQIRESGITSGGVLRYTQSGGTTIIGTKTGGTPESDKPMFSVANSGSTFNYTGGSIIISNHLANASTPSLYLDPTTSNIGSGTNVQFGDASTVAGFNDLSIQSLVNLSDLIVDNSSATSAYPTLTLINTSLTLDNELTIEANTTFDAAGLDLNVDGNFTNNGTFTSNNNATTLNGGTAQVVTGNGTTFYNLYKSGSNTVQLAVGSSIVVANDFSINSGTFDDNNNDITVTGTVHNAAIHTNTNGTKTNGGIVLNGASAQSITGAGAYSRLEINNASDVTINANISISEQVKLTSGSLDIQGFELAMSEYAVFVDAADGNTAFSSSNMIQTRRSFTDAGIIKTFNLEDTDGLGSNTFTFPIGSGTKYTPVVIRVDQNAQTSASIAVRAADEPHPNIQEDVDVPEFVDQDNALQYYWEITSIGMTDFLGNITMTYVGSDAYVTSPFTLDNYGTGRLLPDNSDNWNKLSTGFNYQSRDGSNTLSFDINSAAADDEISGDYTAGIDDAIPDQVQTVISNVLGGTGNWSDDSSWDLTAPRGAIVEILAGDEIIMDANDLLAYRTLINGTLTISATSNQRLGRVSGNGTLVISGNGNLPAGLYDEFFNCATGGTLAFNDSDNYTLPNEIASVRSLLLMGGGTKSFPNTDITICDNLEIQTGVSLNNDFNVDVEIQGNLTVAGTLNLGSNSNYIVNGNVDLGAGTISLGNNTLTINGNLNISGGNLVLGANGSIAVDGGINLTNGTITGANSSSVSFGGDLNKTTGVLSVDATTTVFNANGTVDQSILGDYTGTESFYSLTINKFSGGITIVDGGNDVEVDGILTLTSGDLSTDIDNTLTITSTGSISGGSTTSYVNGPLTKNDIALAADFIFPIGITSRFGYAKIIGVGTGGQNWTAEYTGSNANEAATIDVTTNTGYGVLVELSDLNTWSITPSGANTANLEMGTTAGMGVREIGNVRIAIYNGPTASQWVNLGGSSSGTNTDGSVTTQVATDFSSSTFSFAGINGTALPVVLLSFDAAIVASTVELVWVTASEKDNDYFIVERSTDLTTYEYVDEITGSGTTNEETKYRITDNNPYFGTAYYRLVQIDYDGTETIYPAISIYNDGFYPGLDAILFPNPTNVANINMRLVTGDETANIQVMIIDMMGNLVHRQEANPVLGLYDYSINLRSSIPVGVYQVIIEQGQQQQTRRLIIR